MSCREVSSCEELQENDKLWLVNPDRQFIWPTFEVGHLVEVRHVGTSNGEPIVVETLSKSPKVRNIPIDTTNRFEGRVGVHKALVMVGYMRDARLNSSSDWRCV